MSNTLGKIFRITSLGESHGEGVGVVIDGCPAGIPLSISDIETLSRSASSIAKPVFTSARFVL